MNNFIKEFIVRSKEIWNDDTRRTKVIVCIGGAVGCLLLMARPVYSQIVTKISQYLNLAVPASGDLFIIARPGITNFNIRYDQLKAAVSTGTFYGTFSGTFPTVTVYSSNVVGTVSNAWFSLASFYSTNATYAGFATNANFSTNAAFTDIATNLVPYATITNLSGYPGIQTNGQVLGTLTLRQFQRTNTSDAITITSLTGATGNDSLSGVLVISNSAAASVLVTWPAEWINNLMYVSAYCTNAECMVISVNCLPGVMTNAAIMRSRAGAAGVAP